MKKLLINLLVGAGRKEENKKTERSVLIFKSVKCIVFGQCRETFCVNEGSIYNYINMITIIKKLEPEERYFIEEKSGYIWQSFSSKAAAEASESIIEYEGLKYKRENPIKAVSGSIVFNPQYPDTNEEGEYVCIWSLMH